MSIAFKEWALVCEALGRGEQSIILRKGGIAEGRTGFRFQHPEFLLLPTLFHEQAAKLRVPAETALPAQRSDGQLEVRFAARVEWTQDIADWVRHATRVPNSSGCIEGVINLRGRILPVFNMRRKLGMPELDSKGGIQTVMIVDPDSKVQGASADAGLLVDDVADVVRISAQDIDGATASFSGGGVVEGTVNLGGRLVTLLSMEALLDS